MPDFTAADRRWMRRALALARRGWGRTSPNPMVGAVVVRNDRVVGEGWHASHGAAHAERMALDAAGSDAHGGTLYVTLEPCNHTGNTPPCAPMVAASGVKRVVYATRDPNPAAAGGHDVLQRAGINVESGLFEPESRELNAAFHSRFSRTRPFVTLKLAVSIDGGLSNPTRGIPWLTREEARREVHRMRAAHDAIAVGIGTVLADDPQLTVRGVRRPRISPLRVVFDRHGRLPPGSKLVATASRVPTIVVTSPQAGDSAALAASGVDVLPSETLDAALAALTARGVDSILVEGGARLAGAFLHGGVVDRLVIFQTPVMLGAGAVPAFAWPADRGPIASRWQLIEETRFGDDVKLKYAPSR